MKILAIVPARSGSKGIKDKNIIDVCSKPLIAYSIEQGLKLKSLGLIEQLIVSTDSNKIAKISEKLGASVPFLRPKKISNDHAKSIDLYIHALDFFERQQIFYDAILLLQPTSPLRTIEHLKDSIELFSTGVSPSLISVYQEDYVNDLVIYNKLDGRLLTPKNKNHNLGIRRQDHEKNLIRNGAIYISDTSYIKKYKRIISEKPLFVEMKKNESINIDNNDDLELVRKLICK